MINQLNDAAKRHSEDVAHAQSEIDNWTAHKTHSETEMMRADSIAKKIVGIIQ